MGLCLAAMLCCALWGSAFPFIKIGYSLFSINSADTASQILFAGIRFAAAGIMVIIFGSVLSSKPLVPKKENIPRVAILSLFQTILQYIFFYIGLANTTGTKSSVINSTSVFFAVIISCVFLRQERLTVQKAARLCYRLCRHCYNQCGRSVCGRRIFTVRRGFILFSSLSYAVSTVLIKRFSQYENTVTLSGYQFALGGAVMILAGFIFGGRLSAVSIKGVALLVYLAFLSAAAYTLWGLLLRYNDVSRVAVFGFMTPVFGCVFSALFLGESLAENGIKTVAALVLVCIGIVMVNYKNNKRRQTI